MKKVVLVTLVLGLPLPAVANEKVIDTYKSEHCGYCSLWGKVTEKDGFKMRTHVMNDQVPSVLKKEYSAPARLYGCHTAAAGEPIIEGHVPATAIYQAMQPGPDTYGLVTPGMPVGDPGMETGGRKEAYDVIAFAPDGSQNVLQKIGQTLIAGRRHRPV